MQTQATKKVAIAVISALLFTQTPAMARVPQGPSLDSLSAGCKILQNESDGLLAEYAGEKTSARAGDILARLRAIASDWDQICKGAFGSITSKKVPKVLNDALQPRLNSPDGKKLK